MAQDTSSNTTIFVETEPKSFRDVVQRLTGKFPVNHRSSPAVIKPMKLHQRRQPLRPNLEIMKPDSMNHRGGLKSPSTVFTSLSITDDQDNNSPCSNLEEEKKAIEAKRFYLHPSPRSGRARPELLVLFPLTSPAGR